MSEYQRWAYMLPRIALRLVSTEQTESSGALAVAAVA